MDLVAKKAGYRRGGLAGIQTRNGSRSDLVIELRRGYTIRGVVVDADGQPVPDLTVLASTQSLARGRLVRFNLLIQQVTSCIAPLGSSFCRGQSRTDASGRFKINGLLRGEYVLNVLDPHVVMEPHPVVSAGTDRVHLVVREAQSLRILVYDARTSKPVETFSAILVLESGGSSHPIIASGKNGKLDVTFLQEYVNPPSAIRYEVEAQTYETAEGVLPLDAFGHGGARILMHPAPVVEVPIVAVDAAGKPITGIVGKVVSLDGEDAQDVLIHDRGDTFVAMLPLGTWELWISHELGFPLGVPWSRTIVVDKLGWSEKAPLRVEMSLANEVTLVFGGHDVRPDAVAALGFGSSMGQFRLANPFPGAWPLRWYHMPSGEWKIDVSLRDGRTWSGSFIHSGGRTSLVVEF